MDEPAQQDLFVLRAELRGGHKEDVRALAVLSDGSLASGSRDRTISIWKKGEGNERLLSASSTLVGHEDFVTSLCSLPQTDPSSPPALLSGGRDRVGILWDVAASEPTAKLGPFHKWGVSAVAARPRTSSSPAAVFTASLDGTVAQWDFPLSKLPSRVLRGHEGPVQAALVLPGSGALVTASSDRSVRVWLPGAAATTAASAGDGGAASEGEELLASVPSVSPSATLKDAHDDTVRGLALLPVEEGGETVHLLATTGHDALVKLWRLPPSLLSDSPSAADELTPTLAATLVGHTALVYSAAAAAAPPPSTKGKEPASSAPSGPLLATASEDGTARVWVRDGATSSACVSTLRHPGCVWSAAWLPDGDLATACSDGVVRLWTRRGSGREAPEGEAAELSSALAARDGEAAGGKADSAPASLPPGLKLSDPSVLSQPGRPGQTAVVRDASTGAAAVFEFDGTSGEWQRVGDVVGGPDGGDTVAASSTWHGGRHWDHVFDVDVADGAPPLKLPYNRGENPYDAADRFLENEGLPRAYRQQVVEHIIACTGGAASSAAADVSVNVDPFTGGGAYVPGTAMSAGGGLAGAGGASGVTGGGADPFTGDAAAASRAAAASAPSPPAKKAYVLFDAAPRAEAVANKARELASASAAPLLSEAEAAAGGDLDALVAESISSATSATPVPRRSLDLLERMLREWPPEALFPVLDLARLVALSEGGSGALSGDGGGGVALGRALSAALSTSEAASPAAAKVTAARAVANAVRHPPLRSWVTSRAGELAEALAPVAAVAGASGAAATAAASAAAALFNLCLSVSSSPGSPSDAAPRLLSALSGILTGDEKSLDDAVGGFSAAGAAVLCSASAESAALAVDLGLREAAAKILLSRSSDKPRLAEAAGELARALSAAAK